MIGGVRLFRMSPMWESLLQLSQTSPKPQKEDLWMASTCATQSSRIFNLGAIYSPHKQTNKQTTTRALFKKTAQVTDNQPISSARSIAAPQRLATAQASSAVLKATTSASRSGKARCHGAVVIKLLKLTRLQRTKWWCIWWVKWKASMFGKAYGIIQFYFCHPAATKTTWQHVTWSRTRYRLPAAGTSHTDGSAVRKHICQHLCFPQTFQHLQRPMPASVLGLKGADGAVDAHLGHLGRLIKQIRLCFKMSIWASMTTGQVTYRLESQH